MNKIRIFLTGCLSAFAFSCADLDVPPMDIVSDANLFTDNGTVRVYMARLYADMYMWALDGRGAEWRGRNTDNQTGESTTFAMIQPGQDVAGEWNYSKIRNLNYFLQEFPNHAGKFPEANANAFMGEVYFLRAHQYFTMVQRYGGIPIIERVLNYPEESVEELTYPRSKETEVYDFILADLDRAAELLPVEATAAVGLSDGCATKYAALGLKARVALYAASIAKNGEKYTGQYDGIVGIPANRAEGYFKIAYAAAKETENGKYELLDEGDDKAANYTNIFLGKTKETMFARNWAITFGHNFDPNYQPAQMSGYSSDAQPFLELIESFDDINGNPLVLNTGTDQAPVYYENPLDLFANVEPRLSGSVIFPFANFQGPVELRKGIIAEGHTPADDLNDADIFITAGEVNRYYKVGNDSLQIVGSSGVGLTRQSCITGFLLRKFLNPSYDPTSSSNVPSPWLEMRYAEMLLIRAEAAIELNTYGDASLMGDALTQLNRIKARAGSNKRYIAADLTSKGIQIVRRERKMEFYYEDKTYWDMRRWRTAEQELQGGRKHVLWPIYVWDEGKYYMKKTEDLRGNYNAFSSTWYYNPIPADAISKNGKLIQNPGY